MDKVLIDKITGNKLAEFPSEEVFKLGRYLWEIESVTNSDSDPASISKDLIPDRNGKVVIDQGGISREVNCKSPLLFPGNLGENILEIVEEARSVQSWQEWGDIVPLVRDLDRKLELTDFEQLLIQRISLLKALVASPAAKLTRISEKLPVSRVKRFRNKAINHLAQHSEDWVQRKYRSVIPGRLLAERIEESIDIYENRVTAHLIDRVIAYLDHRITEYDRLMKLMAILDELLEGIESGKIDSWHPKTYRNYTLAGLAYMKNEWEGGSPWQKAKIQLEHCRQVLLVMKGDSFFSQVSKVEHFGRGLEVTNLFGNDQYYRTVFQLWEKFFVAGSKRSDKEIREQFQEQVDGFRIFVLILIFRALNQLKFTPTTTTLALSHGRWTFNHTLFGKLELKWLEKHKKYLIDFQGIDVLEGSDALPSPGLEFLPLPDTLDQNDTALFTSENMSQRGCPYLVYLFQPNQYHIDEPAPITFGKPKGVGFIPVSPEDLDGDERIARVIWYHLSQLHLQRFPVPLTSNLKQTLSKAGGDKMVENGILGGDGNWIKRPLREAEIANLETRIQRVINMGNKDPRQKASTRERLKKIVNELRAVNALAKEMGICISCGERGLLPQYIEEDRYELKCKRCMIRFGREKDDIFLTPDLKKDRLKAVKERFLGQMAQDRIFGKELWNVLV